MPVSTARLQSLQAHLGSPKASKMPYEIVPSKASLKPEKFTAHVSDEELNDFKQLLKLSKIGPKTYENQDNDFNRYLGIKREWLSDAKKHWETSYDWRKTEERINSFPNFTVKIEDIDVHFMALFSKKADAVPITFLHGWPGSFLEFLSVCDVFRQKYSEGDLPVHIIVPSLPGYGYSSGPPLDRDYTVFDLARIIDQLMKGLGFEDGYISQGGDIGSMVSRVLGGKYNACKAVHRRSISCFQWWSTNLRQSISASEHPSRILTILWRD